jgi:phosphate starvation-inducible protein PhoH
MGKPRLKYSSEHETNIEQLTKCAKKKFTPKDLYAVQPKTEGQNKLWRAYWENTPVIINSGYAGTGKTFLSLHLAFQQVFDVSTHYDKVVIVRSSVQTRNKGFLPGDSDEKNAPIEALYGSICNELISYNKPYDNLKALGYLEFMDTAFIRGITFRNAIVVVDEAANMDYEELSTVITRIGENSRIIICGDVRQDDLKRNRETSGFAKFLEVVKGMPYDTVETVEYKFDDIVRSELVKYFIEAEVNYTPPK